MLHDAHGLSCTACHALIRNSWCTMWTVCAGSMVADVHRTILYGGVFLYPVRLFRGRGPPEHARPACTRSEMSFMLQKKHRVFYTSFTHCRRTASRRRASCACCTRCARPLTRARIPCMH